MAIKFFRDFVEKFESYRKSKQDTYLFKYIVLNFKRILDVTYRHQIPL